MPVDDLSLNLSFFLFPDKCYCYCVQWNDILAKFLYLYPKLLRSQFIFGMTANCHYFLALNWAFGQWKMTDVMWEVSINPYFFHCLFKIGAFIEIDNILNHCNQLPLPFFYYVVLLLVRVEVEEVLGAFLT